MLPPRRRHELDVCGAEAYAGRVQMTRNRTRILIAEDDAAIRDLLSAIATRSGYEVDVTGDGGQAVKMAQANEYDVMLLDLMMPGTDGFAVVDTLRRTAPELLRRCVIVTAVGPRQFDHLLPDVFRIIRKPFELADLVRGIDDCLAARPRQSA